MRASGGIHVRLEGQIAHVGGLVQELLGHVIDMLVRDVDRDVRLPADLHRLAPGPRLTEVGVPNVGGVDTAVLADDLAQLNQFAGVGVGTRLIVETQTETGRAGVEPVAGRLLHPVEFNFARRARRPPHRLQANRAVRYLRQDVDGRIAGEDRQECLRRRPVEREFDRRLADEGPREVPELTRQIDRQRCPTETVRGKKVGGNALKDTPVAMRPTEQGDLRVNVNVDETGRHHLATRVDDRPGTRTFQAIDGDNAIAPDPDISRPRLRPGRTVDHRPIGDQDIELHVSLPTITTRRDRGAVVYRANAARGAGRLAFGPIALLSASRGTVAAHRLADPRPDWEAAS